MNAPLCATGCGRPRTRRADGRGWTGAHGYCPACYERWRLAGKPASGPPRASERQRRERISAGLRRWHASHAQSPAALGALADANQVRAAPFTDYAWLISFGEPREQAAARAGVSVRHARYVYEPMLREMAARRDAA